jgi:hypothetical protein
LARAQGSSPRRSRFPSLNGGVENSSKAIWHVERYPATIDRYPGQWNMPEIPHIFFRAEHRIGSRTRGLPLQFGHFLLSINVVIAKASLCDDLKSPFL